MLLNIMSIFLKLWIIFFFLRLIFLYILLRTTYNDAIYISIVFSLDAVLSVLFTGLVLYIHEIFAKPSPRQKSVMKYELGIGVDMRDSRGIMIPL